MYVKENVVHLLLSVFTYTPQGLSETFIFAIPALGLPTFSKTTPAIKLSKADCRWQRESRS